MSDSQDAELARLRSDVFDLRSALAQQQREIDAERAARRAFEADAAQLRQAALAYVRAGSYAERSRLRAELEVLATVDHAGTLLMQELDLLRELSEDLTRWRETGGDIRDLTYVFETMDRIATMKDNTQ